MRKQRQQNYASKVIKVTNDMNRQADQITEPHSDLSS